MRSLSAEATGVSAPRATNVLIVQGLLTRHDQKSRDVRGMRALDTNAGGPGGKATCTSGGENSCPLDEEEEE